METKHQIIIGDSRNMVEIPNRSIELVVTSPPYWQLKDYGNSHQIGFDNNYEDYVNNLNLVWNECFRVLEDGCRLCVNIGDQFARAAYYGRYKVIPIRTEIIKFCETIGFDYLGAVIWRKALTMNTTGGGTVMGSFPYPRNGIVRLDYEFILIFRKIGNPPKISKEIKEQSRLSKEEWNKYFSGHWNFPGTKQNRHLAMFPEELPKRLIKMFSFVGDTILDPFLGSGTTSLVAKKLKRNSVGVEINEQFLPMIEKKLNCKMDIINRQKSEHNLFEDEIQKLPYRFRDKVKIDRKANLPQLQFVSKISLSDKNSIEFHTVREVISPECLLLNNNYKIRLIGIKTRIETLAQAIEFLKAKLKNQRVFMKFEDVTKDEDDNLLCYLYLKNKTFVNAHLIRSGLVAVDEESDYKYKQKFLKIS